MQVVHEIVAHAAPAAVLSHLIEKIGAYAGFASVVGLAVLAALYFSQARDVKRLRDWAGRAPERTAEVQSGGRTPEATAVRTGQPAGRTVGPAQPAQAASAGAKPATAGAQPATAGAQPAPAGARQGPAEKAEPSAAPAAASASPGAAAAAAAGKSAATPAGAAASAGQAQNPSASAGGTATVPERGAKPAASGSANAGTAGPGTGAKVLPARPVQPRPRPVAAGGAGQTAVIPPPERRWPAPRYIALIVAGVLVLGLAGTVGVLALTGSDKSSKSGSSSGGTVSLPSHKKKSQKKQRSFAPAIDPASVTVAVLNSTQVTGLAGRFGQRISAAGFRLGNVATASQQQRAESVVLYRPGQSRQARAVGRKVGVSQIEPVDAQSATLAGTATVVVVLGGDKSGQ